MNIKKSFRKLLKDRSFRIINETLPSNQKEEFKNLVIQITNEIMSNKHEFFNLDDIDLEIIEQQFQESPVKDYDTLYRIVEDYYFS